MAAMTLHMSHDPWLAAAEFAQVSTPWRGPQPRCDGLLMMRPSASPHDNVGTAVLRLTMAVVRGAISAMTLQVSQKPWLAAAEFAQVSTLWRGLQARRDGLLTMRPSASPHDSIGAVVSRLAIFSYAARLRQSRCKCPTSRGSRVCTGVHFVAWAPLPPDVRVGNGQTA